MSLTMFERSDGTIVQFLRWYILAVSKVLDLPSRIMSEGFTYHPKSNQMHCDRLAVH